MGARGARGAAAGSPGTLLARNTAASRSGCRAAAVAAVCASADRRRASGRRPGAGHAGARLGETLALAGGKRPAGVAVYDYAQCPRQSVFVAPARERTGLARFRRGPGGGLGDPGARDAGRPGRAQRGFRANRAPARGTARSTGTRCGGRAAVRGNRRRSPRADRNGDVALVARTRKAQANECG